MLTRQFITFLFVGSMNTVVGYCLYAFFIFLNIHYTLAVLLSTVIGVLFNFQTTGRIVFKNSSQMRIFRFIGVYAFLYILNISFIKCMQPLFNNFYVTGFVAIFPLAMIAFLLNKYIVFRNAYETH